MAVLTVISLAIAGTLSLLASDVIRILVNDSGFQAAVPALRILCWTFPLLCASSLLYVSLVSMNRTRVPLYVLLGASVLSIGLNALVIPAYGIQGTASVALITEAVIVALYLFQYHTTMSPLLDRAEMPASTPLPAAGR
jgi:O-antigen/teichoic acid export membrane protein